MNFNFRGVSKPKRQRLFVPLNAFSFASFIVPIKFRQPAYASASVFARPRARRILFNHSQTQTRGQL